MGVITISRQQGSGGSEIAVRVCDLLGYRYFDKRMMAEAMAQEGFTDETIVDYREDEYRLRGFVDRLLGYRRPKTIADVGFWDKNPDAMKQTSSAVLDEHMAVWLVRSAIESVYQRGNVVIVGRGGQAILRDKPGVFHVRIESPLEARVKWVADHQHLGQKEAQQYVVERDKASAEYLQRFYGVNWSDPTLYHVVINASKWDSERVAQCIVGSLRCIEQVPSTPA
jgi:CMP/dCMP kinase